MSTNVDENEESNEPAKDTEDRSSKSNFETTGNYSNEALAVDSGYKLYLNS